ncbi:MAG: hypothetical protein HKN69_08490 [Desulfofustis sp.]|nr:hypothetical protein [Desulfofustis sp.]
MESNSLHLSWVSDGSTECDCLLIIPERAIKEHGYIKAMHRSTTGNKHELQALAQTCYYQFQDDELDYCETAEPIEVVHGTEREVLEDGMVLFREAGGTIRAVMYQAAPAKKLLEAANRFCTRWVRLDI